jgi:hypothetical protein
MEEVEDQVDRGQFPVEGCLDFHGIEYDEINAISDILMIRMNGAASIIGQVVTTITIEYAESVGSASVLGDSGGPVQVSIHSSIDADRHGSFSLILIVSRHGEQCAELIQAEVLSLTRRYIVDFGIVVVEGSVELTFSLSEALRVDRIRVIGCLRFPDVCFLHEPRSQRVALWARVTAHFLYSNHCPVWVGSLRQGAELAESPGNLVSSYGAFVKEDLIGSSKIGV